uniref:Uncharacterized protein n=1 Tax=Lutzomyia longipalpis TaxID=7200 RepID=A0A1B0GK76_LUTLO
EIPIVIAGNKLDLASTHREVKIEDVSEWVFCELPKLRDVVKKSRGVCLVQSTEIPIVIAGNKLDLASTHREVKIEDVSEWVFCELPKLRAKVLECSAKDDTNITDLFKSLLSISKIMPIGGGESTSGLKRRSSAYVSATSKVQFQSQNEGRGCENTESEVLHWEPTNQANRSSGHHLGTLQVPLMPNRNPDRGHSYDVLREKLNNKYKMHPVLTIATYSKISAAGISWMENDV